MKRGAKTLGVPVSELLTLKRSPMRKPLHRAADRRPPERVTTNEIMTWLAERLAQDPQLRRSIQRVLAALRKAEATPIRRRRRAQG